jgi:hypothetical protein
MTQFTPNMSIPYPEASDPPRGWEQMQALATQVDSGSLTWTPIPYASGFTTYNQAIRVAKFGGLVFMRGTVKRTDSGIMNGNINFGTVPAAFWPAQLCFAWAAADWDNGNRNGIRLDINPDGGLTALVGTNSAWLSLDGVHYALGS